MSGYFSLEKFTRNLVVLYGGMTIAERRVAGAGLKTPDGEERLVLATGRYLGEVSTMRHWIRCS